MSAYVYRAFACDGRLLYVGYTAHPVLRMRAHSHVRTPSIWWQECHQVTLQRYETEREAQIGEALAILAEFPFYNVYGRSPIHPDGPRHSNDCAPRYSDLARAAA